eukprot:3461193-Pyramimonas_sp.AAC.2
MPRTGKTPHATSASRASDIGLLSIVRLRLRQIDCVVCATTVSVVPTVSIISAVPAVSAASAVLAVSAELALACSSGKGSVGHG